MMPSFLPSFRVYVYMYVSLMYETTNRISRNSVRNLAIGSHVRSILPLTLIKLIWLLLNFGGQTVLPPINVGVSFFFVRIGIFCAGSYEHGNEHSDSIKGGEFV
jgi:hypothetical protein